jgi:hypothetical protein
MSDAEHDPLLRRAVEELRQMPAVDPEAVRRLIGAAAAARVTPVDAELGGRRSAVAGRHAWILIGLAAAGLVGFMTRGRFVSSAAQPANTIAASAPSTAPPSQPAAFLHDVSAADPSLMTIPQPFVIENAVAHRVSVVGDFNTWNPAATPMLRSPQGLWSAVVPLAPGRHIYGFMIDDSLFVLDPRAPKSRDPDLGTEGSVMMVGRP